MVVTFPLSPETKIISIAEQVVEEGREMVLLEVGRIVGGVVVEKR